MNTAYEHWVSIFESGTDYEADIVRDRLDTAGIPAVVLDQRDHAFNLTHGALARVRVMVPPEQAEKARRVLALEITEDELTREALSADPEAPDAHDPTIDARLGSSGTLLDFSVPEDKPNTEEEEEEGA